MSKKRCCVPGCNNEENLHFFPNPKKRSKDFWTWLLNIKGEALYNGYDEQYIYNNRRVCSVHFEPQFIYMTRLSRVAVPTLYLKAPSVNDGSGPSVLSAVQTEEPTAAVTNTSDTERIHIIDSETKLAQHEPNVNDGSGPSVLSAVQTEGPTTVVTNASDINITTRESTEQIHIMDSQKSKTKLARDGSKIKPLEKHEYMFCKEIKRTKKRISILLKKCNNFKLRLREARKLQKTQAFNYVSKKLSKAAKTLVEAIVTQSHKKSKGRRYTIQQKVLCLSLYKTSPKMYRLLSSICGLPGRKTLNNLLSQVDLTPGKNDKVFIELKRKVRAMPQHHKYASVIFDEMKISPGLAYNKKKDKIDGFVDDGFQRYPKLADHALVFMVRGAIKKYKQPFWYSFCKGATRTESLKKQISATIDILQKIGFIVIATVCDQGQSNQAAINSLLEETKANYLRMEKEYKGAFFEINNKKIVPIFDPPHLLKGIRNNLLTKDLKFEQDGCIKVAKWQHLLLLYKKSPKYSGVRLVPKLTARHIIPKKIPKMKVKYATQVFSRSVGVALGYLSNAGHLSEGCKDTADALLFFDNLFDSVNGGSSKIRNGKILRSALTPRSPHHSLWRQSLKILKSIKFVAGQKLCNVPSIKNWVRTIESFQLISNELRQKSITSILPRNFNQDPLENFFGAVRAQGCQNLMPNVRQFEASYKTLCVNKYALKNPEGSNCENDENPFLQSLQYFLTSQTSNIKPNEIQIIHEKHLYFEIKTIESLQESQSLAEKEKIAAVGYCSGWLLKVLKTKIKCEECRLSLESKDIKDFHDFIICSEYSDKVWLTYPTKEFIDCFFQIESIAIMVLKEDPSQNSIAYYCNLLVSIHVDFGFIKCGLHKNNLINLVTSKALTFCILNWCKEVNEIISGKNLVFDDDDSVKKEALTYFESMNKKH